VLLAVAAAGGALAVAPAVSACGPPAGVGLADRVGAISAVTVGLARAGDANAGASSSRLHPNQAERVAGERGKERLQQAAAGGSS